MPYSLRYAKVIWHQPHLVEAIGDQIGSAFRCVTLPPALRSDLVSDVGFPIVLGFAVNTGIAGQRIALSECNSQLKPPAWRLRLLAREPLYELFNLISREREEGIELQIERILPVNQHSMPIIHNEFTQ